jgi:type IV fimbrial biogenesis protein FimT
MGNASAGIARSAIASAHGRRSAGWSLAEMMIGLAIAALLLVLGVPAYQEWMASQQLLHHAQLLAQSLTLARTEAVKHGYRVNVCKSADGRECADNGRWDMGFLMHTDDNADGVLDVDEALLRIEGRAPNDITIDANRPLDDYVSFTSLGHARLLSGALQMGTFTVCKPGRDALLVVLANSGRVRIDRSKQRCP